VIQVGECRSDHEMLNDLAHRIGQGQYWWDNFEQALDYILHPTGVSWKDFKKMDYIRGEVKYHKYKESVSPPLRGSLSYPPRFSKSWGTILSPGTGNLRESGECTGAL